jgi:hypothetical protein
VVLGFPNLSSTCRENAIARLDSGSMVVPSAERGEQAMPLPFLYEQPFKDQLQREITELKRESWNERKEHMQTRQLLRIARANIEALEFRIEGMKRYLQSAIVEANHDIGPAVVERYRKSLQIELDDAATG